MFQTNWDVSLEDDVWMDVISSTGNFIARLPDGVASKQPMFCYVQTRSIWINNRVLHSFHHVPSRFRWKVKSLCFSIFSWPTTFFPFGGPLKPCPLYRCRGFHRWSLWLGLGLQSEISEAAGEGEARDTCNVVKTIMYHPFGMAYSTYLWQFGGMVHYDSNHITVDNQYLWIASPKVTGLW